MKKNVETQISSIGIMGTLIYACSNTFTVLTPSRKKYKSVDFSVNQLTCVLYGLLWRNNY